MRKLLGVFALVLFLAAGRAEDVKPPKLPVTGVVTVHVLDLNCVPLAGFEASYFVQGGIPSLTTTNANGNFTITGLQVGNVFSFLVTEPGWFASGWADQNYQGDWTYYVWMMPNGF